MADWISTYTDSDVLLWASDHLIQPIGRILIVLILASIGLRFIRRAINRGIERVQDPEGMPGRKLRERVGMFDEFDSGFSARRAQRAQALGALAGSVAGFVIWTLALFMVLGTFGINLGPLIAGAGIAGVALGFGAQSVVKDFLSGVLMLLEDQYGVGDVIDTGEAIGIVEAVTLRTTRVRDVTGTLWHIPNGEIRRVGNKSQDWARVLLDVGVSYGTDLDVAKQIIQRVADELVAEPDFAANVIEEPSVWGVQELGDSSIDLRLVIKVVPGTQWAMTRELRRRIKMAFDAANVEIPYPQRTVWLRTEAPVAVGDEATPAFDTPIPDVATIDEAVALTKAPPPADEELDALEDVVESSADDDDRRF
ncbi:MAG: mechanosensitive ion channel family protein [Nitriliruptoraceae bacterium]